MGKNKEKRRYGSASEVAEKRSSGANYGYITIPKDVKMFTPEPDTVAVIDILPYEVKDSNHMDKIDVGTIWYKKPFKVHKNVGPSDDSCVCPTTFGKACPICDHGEELKKDEDADEKQIEKTKAKYRNLYAVKVLSYDGKKKFDKKAIHLFDFSDYLFQEVFETQLKKKKDFDTFFLPEEGKSLEITFDEGSFGGFKFTKVTRIDFVDRKKQYDEDIIDSTPNLDTDCLKVLSYEELEAKFFGDDVSVDSDEETKKDKKKDKKKKEKSKEEAPDEPEQETKKEKKSKKDKKGKKEKEEPTLAEIIKETEDIGELIDLVKGNAIFAEYKKELKKIEKIKKLKSRMLEILYELPFDDTAGKPEEGEKSKNGKKDKVKEKCPYNHKFGKDCDKYDDCADCDLWEACKAEKKALKKNK